MLKFIKGNPEKLEGKVLVYSHNLDLRPDPLDDLFLSMMPENLFTPQQKDEFKKVLKIEYPALYSSSSMFDMISYVSKKEGGSSPEDEREKIMRAEREIRDKMGGKEGFFTVPTWLKSLDEIDGVDADIINAGEARTKIESGLILHHSCDIYVINYLAQVDKKLGLVSGYKREIREFKDNADLRKELYSSIGSLMDALKRNDRYYENEITAKLRSFSPCVSITDIANLIGTAKTDYKNKTIIIEKRIEKICAIQLQDYEKAAALRDEIKTLEKEV